MKRKRTLRALTYAIKMMETHDVMQISCDGYFIEMLKEARELIQDDPVQAEVEGGGSSWWWVCGDCHGTIDRGDIYCRNCGRKIKWE